MEVITLSQEEITKYQVIKDSLDRKISNNQAATLLGLSTRQIIRLKSKVRGADLRGIVHGNRGKPPKTAIGKETKETILNLY
ncbi:MAG: Integrase catalytic subunit, partial [Candidatus Dadabacteria bacterium CSP1-2]